MLPPPTTLPIKRPSPDWNVRNADVTALDKLVVTVLSWIRGRDRDRDSQGSRRKSLWREPVNLTAQRTGSKLGLKLKSGSRFT